MTTGFSVNTFGKSFLFIRIKAMNTTPIAVEVRRVTTAENFAALGFPAPSSFDTRTLQAN